MIRGARSHLTSAFVLAALLLLAPDASAQDDAPVVVVVFEGTWDGALRGDVWADLGSMLRDRGIRLLSETDAPSTRLATIRLAAPDAARTTRVAIEDQLTAKLVERALDLSGEEPDTWSTVIAAGGDELLRASWVELSMRSAPPPARPPPPEVERIVEDAIAPLPQSESLRVGLSVRGELLAAERALALGASVGVVFALHPHVELGIRAALDGIVPASSARAQVDGLVALGDLELAAPLLDRGEPIQLSLVAIGRIGAAWMHASASTGLTASDAAALLGLAGGGARFAVVTGGTRLELGALVLAPLASVRGSDGIDDVVAIAGPVGLVELGVELWP